MKLYLMKFLILLLVPFIIGFTQIKPRLEAPQPEKGKLPEEISTKKLDKEAKILASYLSKYNSPMQYHAQDFVDAAKQYGLDWKMVPAIAGVESTFGKHIPGGYNAYGWAIYTPDSRYAFKSWRDGIFVVTKGLKQDYVDKGLTDPYSMNKKYAASPTWGSKVNYFMKDLEKFAQNYVGSGVVEYDIIFPQLKIAAASGILDNGK